LDKNTEAMLIELKEISDRKAEMKEEESTLNKRKEYLQKMLVSFMQAEGLDKLSIKGVGTASLKTKEVYTPEDWPQIYGYILEHKEFGLLHKRLSSGLLKELEESGINVPGIKKLEFDDVSFRKSSK
jgi:hypothetical protein